MSRPKKIAKTTDKRPLQKRKGICPGE